MNIERETSELAARLIACRSLTPSDGGALDLVAGRLGAAGFVCERIDRGGVGNLWALFGQGSPLVCLAGHVDVVPPGPLDQWTSDPFTPVERDGQLYGRGAADMKGSIAAMVTAAERFVSARIDHRGSLALLLTADEEGDALHGTTAVVDALLARGVAIDACLIGEPTSSGQFGDTLKNGRRGSLSGLLRVQGVQCHIAYPERGSNPNHTALAALAELASLEWDRGNEYFPPTSFQISNMHGGTGAPNIIPGVLEVQFNFRFSPASTADDLKRRVHAVLDAHQVRYTLDWTLNAEPFMTPRGPLVQAISNAVASVTGVVPALSTSGGTSDGRFLTRIARQVAEFGPINDSIHKVNERVRVEDLGQLSLIYERVLLNLLG